MVCLFDPTENTIKSIVFMVVTKIVGHLNYFLINPRIMIVQKNAMLRTRMQTECKNSKDKHQLAFVQSSQNLQSGCLY